MGRKRFAVVLLLALLLVLAPSALATKYLVISESDTNYLNFIARYRAINKSLGYPNTATKTTRFTEHWVKTSPSVSSMMVMSDGVYTAVEPYLTTNEKNAVVSELPSGYSLNTAVTIYNAEFSALTTGMAIINESDSIASSPNGEFALALPDRFYYKLGQLAQQSQRLLISGLVATSFRQPSITSTPAWVLLIFRVPPRRSSLFTMAAMTRLLMGRTGMG